MSNLLWKSLLVSPAVLGATLVVSTSAYATTNQTSADIAQPDVAQTQAADVQSVASIETAESTATPEIATATTPVFSTAQQPQMLAQVTSTPAKKPATNDANVLEQVNRYSSEGKGSNSLSQVTSVSQFSDVQPTDWAFQALQSLVERYGCIAGYPDGTYRGNRALTRYEFAAGLNACLDRINELIATATADLVTKEDLATLQRLQEEFSAELATLRGRVDALEARTAELEANQFSTTTKLVGEAIIAVTDTFGENNDTQTVLGDRVRLDLQTSFTGRDILHTRLAAGNLDAFDLGAGTAEGTQTFNLKPEGNNDVAVDWLAYEFPFGASNVYLAAAGGIHADYAPTLNPYFYDGDGGNGALSVFAQQSPIYRIGGGQGIGVRLGVGRAPILGPTSLTLGYLADNGSNPDDDFGLFNGDYAALAQLNFTVGDRLGVAATYVHGYHNRGNAIFDAGATERVSAGSVAGIVGTASANLPNLQRPGVTNSYGLQAAFRFSDRISLSGFVSYTDFLALGGVDDDDQIWSYGLGVALPDLGKRGNVLGIFAGAQPYSGPDSDDRPYHIEGFYKYRVSDNISITPGIIWLTAPNQSDDNDDAVIGTIRTTFTF